MQMGLIERDAELAAIAGTLDDALAGRGNVLLIEGPGGIGKSSLLAAAVTAARERGLRVLRARGGELEAGTPWGVAAQLAPTAGGEPFAVMHELFWAIEQAAPALVTVD